MRVWSHPWGAIKTSWWRRSRGWSSSLLFRSLERGSLIKSKITPFRHFVGHFSEPVTALAWSLLRLAWGLPPLNSSYMRKYLDGAQEEGKVWQEEARARSACWSVCKSLLARKKGCRELAAQPCVPFGARPALVPE